MARQEIVDRVQQPQAPHDAPPRPRCSLRTMQSVAPGVEGEIARVRAQMQRKEAGRAAADALFSR